VKIIQGISSVGTILRFLVIHAGSTYS